MPSNILDTLVELQKRGEARGLTSICSAHPYVLRAAMRRAARTSAPVLVESTCNQVNQSGGYSGMTPADFAAFVHAEAGRNGVPARRVLLGGDHLGPYAWQAEPAESAMQKAEILVRDCVRTGYAKLHLDASMHLGDDDPGHPLEVELSARRTARLAQAAEAAWQEAGGAAPRYVIGSEVPPPGGARERGGHAAVTAVGSLRQTLDLTRDAFAAHGLESAWERVRAVVVQPGVEFGDEFVQAYDPRAARPLRRLIRSQAGIVFEAHSTDHQTRGALRQLVGDGFAILKVGPALTFAFRRAAFALARIEDELFPPGERSNLIEVLEQAMLRHPQHWQKYYHGGEQAQRLKRRYSLSDRIRYYWAEPQVQAAFERLLENLRRKPPPLTLLDQFLPDACPRVRAGQVENSPEALILDRVEAVLDDYAWACGD